MTTELERFGFISPLIVCLGLKTVSIYLGFLPQFKFCVYIYISLIFELFLKIEVFSYLFSTWEEKIKLNYD